VLIGDRTQIVESPGESADGLVAYEPAKDRRKKDGCFRCVQTEFRMQGKKIEIPKDAAKALKCDDGDRVWALALTKHTKM
jgi:hypothetical protein